MRSVVKKLINIEGRNLIKVFKLKFNFQENEIEIIHQHQLSFNQGDNMMKTKYFDKGEENSMKISPSVNCH